MLKHEDEVAELFGLLQSGDAANTVDQFASLPQANQYRKLYSLTAQHVPKGAHVLDWGCGNGHFSLYLALRGFRVTSYSFDPAPAAFDLLEAREPGLRFVRGSTDDPRRLPFEDGEFDCVFSIGVLEHVRETGGTEADSLREIRRVTRPGGKFVCYHLPNQYSWIEAINRAVYRPRRGQGPGKYYHPYRFREADIRSLCEGAGLSIVDVMRYGAIPRNVLGRLPASLRTSQAFATTVNLSDMVLETALSPIAQNYAFVVQRPR